MSRNSDMTAAELKAIIDEVYGNRQQRRLAAELERSEVTVSRWLSGQMPIGGIESLTLRLILMLHRRGHNWRKWLEDYKKDPGDQGSLPDSIEEML